MAQEIVEDIVQCGTHSDWKDYKSVKSHEELYRQLDPLGAEERGKTPKTKAICQPWTKFRVPYWWLRQTEALWLPDPWLYWRFQINLVKGFKDQQRSSCFRIFPKSCTNWRWLSCYLENWQWYRKHCYGFSSKFFLRSG